MAKPKPIATVQLGIARLGLILSDLPDDAARGAFIRTFHRALALQQHGINEYADELMLEVEEFRRAEAERKAGRRGSPADSAGQPRKAEESVHQSVSQSVSKPNTPSLYPPRVLKLIDLYATGDRGERGKVVVSEREQRDLAVAVDARPDYPWEAAVSKELKAGPNIRGVTRFLLDLPAPDTAMRAAQARFEATNAREPQQVPEDAPEAPLWPGMARFQELTQASLRPGFTAEARAELEALSNEYKETYPA